MPCSDFHSQLNELRCHKKYCDVNIRVEGERFPCHRVVLAAASEYFKAMFGGCFKEEHDQEIVLQDIEAKSFKEIVQSVYTGKACKITTSNVHNLIHTALFLGIRNIEKSCAKFILKNLPSIHDHLDIFRLVRAINMTALTDALSEYIVKHFKSFYADERFMEMPFDDLKFILDKWVHDKLPFKHENLLLDLLTRWVQYAPKARRKYFKEFIEVVNFERISPEYIVFTLKYFENVIEVSDAENAPEMNIKLEMNKNGANCELSGIEDSKNRLLLKEKILKYFTDNEWVTGSNSEQAMGPPFEDPNFCKGELGLHVYLEYIAYSYNCNSGSGSFTTERWKKGDVFSMTKYRPDWFLSCETDAWYRCEDRVMAPQQSTDTIYCLETFQDEQESSNFRQSFCTYSSIDMRLPSNVLTPPPIPSSDDYKPSLCATKSDIFLLNPRDWWYTADENVDSNMYQYNSEIDKWFPVQEPPGQENCERQGTVLSADDNLVYLIETYGGVQILDSRIARWMQLPDRNYYIEHYYSRNEVCTLNGNIYLTWETYDAKAGKWRRLKRPEYKNMNSDDHYKSTFRLVKLLSYENMLWSVAETSSRLSRTSNVASYNTASEEWYISHSLNEILPSCVQKLKANNPSYIFDHKIKDVVVFKTQ